MPVHVPKSMKQYILNSEVLKKEISYSAHEK